VLNVLIYLYNKNMYVCMNDYKEWY